MIFKAVGTYLYVVVIVLLGGVAAVADNSGLLPDASANRVIQLGDSTVVLEISRHGTGPVFVALHENESTAIAAAQRLLPVVGGTLIVLRHTGNRNVTFTLAGDAYAFDPNRIFTAGGIQNTLRGGSSPDAVAAVVSFAQAVVSEIGHSPIIALHNNTNGEYSLLSYLDGNNHNRDARAVYQAAGQDPDDFFFTTDTAVYEQASQDGYNIVLQSGSPVDDGSLSVYSARHGLLYVNVETQHGHMAVQVQMLQWLSANWR